MTYFDALILGVIQGISEFLPISSSAHLRLAQIFLEIETDLSFDVFCHIGTLSVIVFLLRRDIKNILFKKHPWRLSLVYASLPLLFAPFLLPIIKSLCSHPLWISPLLSLNAMILLLGTKVSLSLPKQLDALWIGSAQLLALLPGLSRSGSTLSASLSLNWPLKKALRFSFLLSIPATAGAALLSLWEGEFNSPFPIYLIGILSSAFVGFFVFNTLLSYIEKISLRPFALYCFCLSALSFYFLY